MKLEVHSQSRCLQSEEVVWSSTALITAPHCSVRVSAHPCDPSIAVHALLQREAWLCSAPSPPLHGVRSCASSASPRTAGHVLRGEIPWEATEEFPGPSCMSLHQHQAGCGPQSPAAELLGWVPCWVNPSWFLGVCSGCSAACPRGRMGMAPSALPLADRCLHAELNPQ